jgi:hypothetical protein
MDSVQDRIADPISRIPTSCGLGVPRAAYGGHGDQHQRWAASKGPEGLAALQRANDLIGIDGLPAAPGRTEAR